MSYSDKYLAFVLDVDSRNELIKLFLPSYQRFVCHHVTLVFDNLTEETVVKYLNKELYVRVTGFYKNNEFECFSIHVNGESIREDGKPYHLTYSLADGKKAKDSIQALQTKKICVDRMLGGSVYLLDKPKESQSLDEAFSQFKYLLKPMLRNYEEHAIACFIRYVETGIAAISRFD